MQCLQNLRCIVVKMAFFLLLISHVPDLQADVLKSLSFAFLPDFVMNNLGAQSFEAIKRKTPLDKDPVNKEYVECVANTLIKVAKDDTGVKKWTIEVFKDDSANAFALPGGKIGVHSGILKVAKTPAQLAAVLGHEIGHVIARHGNQRMSQTFAVQGALVVANTYLSSKNSPHCDAIMGALGVGAQLGVLLPFSRSHESDADEIGQELIAKAGFDPAASIELWKNMAQRGGKAPAEYFSTHPSHENRIKDLEANLKKANKTFQKAQNKGRIPNCTAPVAQ